MVSQAQEVLIISGCTFQFEMRRGLWKMEALIRSLGAGMVVRECFLEEAVGLSAEVRRTGRSWMLNSLFLCAHLAWLWAPARGSCPVVLRALSFLFYGCAVLHNAKAPLFTSPW